MIELSYRLAVLFVSLHIPASQSLKDKRMVLKSIKDKVRNNFNVSIAEVDGLDKWQVATLGFITIGTDGRYLNSILENLLSSLEANRAVEICEHKIEML